MLSQSKNVTIPDQAVTYKFKMPDLADLFEGLSAEQTHIALEGTLNTVFGQPRKDLSSLSVEEEEQDEEEDQLDHESEILSATVFALVAHQQGDDGEIVPVEGDVEDSPLYTQLEETFRGIVDKFAEEVANDKFNQDIITLSGEMQYYNHLELFTYMYDSKNEILSVTVTATNTTAEAA